MNGRPRCGRRTTTGAPCQALVRYSAPLDAHAPACKAHLTARELEALTAEPLWSVEGQVGWLLRTGTAEPLAATVIARRLRLQTPPVVAALRRLRECGEARVLRRDDHDAWATPEVVVRCLAELAAERERAEAARAVAARRAAAVDQAVEQLARHLREVCAGRSVDVRVVGEESPTRSLVLSVEDPAAARWLLATLASADGAALRLP
ncbi:hypothetical protein [Saccharothrix sp. Mg75]|uniref:hypothetical protein n=1 Tax=Saccharothrix sp. Mg75 TaxID=3445357 RepID=UPI003EEE98F1